MVFVHAQVVHVLGGTPFLFIFVFNTEQMRALITFALPDGDSIGFVATLETQHRHIN